MYYLLLFLYLIIIRVEMNKVNQKLLGEAKELFATMVGEEDRDKRREIKIDIDYLCLKGKFDYTTFVYGPMVLALKKAVEKA